MITGAYIYDSCVSSRMAAAAAADYISKRSAAVERSSNSAQYWPGKIHIGLQCHAVSTVIRFFNGFEFQGYDFACAHLVLKRR